MTGLESIVTNPVAIKTVAEKTEGLLKVLFGKAFEETAEMIADQVRLRRFKIKFQFSRKLKNI